VRADLGEPNQPYARAIRALVGPFRGGHGSSTGDQRSGRTLRTLQRLVLARLPSASISKELVVYMSMSSTTYQMHR